MLFSAQCFGDGDFTTIKKEEDDSGVGFTMDVRESEPIDLSKLFGNGAQEKETPPAKIFPKQPKITLAQALTKMQAAHPSSTMKPTYECQNCINSLIPIEKNLIRMESKMAAMVTMVKKRQSLRAAVKTRQTPTIVSRTSLLPSKSIAKQEYLERKVVIKSPFTPGPSSLVRTPGSSGPPKRLIFSPLVQKPTSSTPSPAFAGNQLVDPKREEARYQVARSKFLQAFLLFPGREFAYGNFFRRNQEVCQKLTLKQIEEILEQLIDDRLMFQQDDEQPPKTHPSTVWMKETARYKLRALKNYPVTVTDFVESFDA